jgi:hypothetical protein
MQLVRAPRIRNDSVHLNPTEPTQSEIETLSLFFGERIAMCGLENRYALCIWDYRQH